MNLCLSKFPTLTKTSHDRTTTLRGAALGICYTILSFAKRGGGIAAEGVKMAKGEKKYRRVPFKHIF
jgi:hypothetical protein